MRPDERHVPASGLKGWGAAKKVLQRVEKDERRTLLAGLVANAGVQTAPALDYVARLLRWMADEADAPVAPMKLTDAEAEFCRSRCRSLLEPFIGDPRISEKVRGMPDVGTQRAAA